MQSLLAVQPIRYVANGDYLDFPGPLGASDDGKVPVWDNDAGAFVMQTQSSGGGTPGGSSGQWQYNNAGAFAGDSGVTRPVAGVVQLSTALVTPVIRPENDGAASVQWTDAAGANVLMRADTTNKMMILPVVKSSGTGAPGTTRADSYFEWLKPDGTLSWYIRNDGLASFSGGLAVQSQFFTYTGLTFWSGNITRGESNSPQFSPQTTSFELRTRADTNKGLVVKANSGSQSANLMEAQTSAAAVMFAIGPAGSVRTNQSSANTNTPSGATAYQLPIYNESGTLLGYIPIYGSAW